MTSQQKPPTIQAAADAALQRAAEELGRLLQDLARRLDPFPFFMGLCAMQAVEVDPQGFQDSQRGCVVVGPDGGLYELVLKAEMADPEIGGGMEQDSELRPLELPPATYIPYAYAAIAALGRILRERGQA